MLRADACILYHRSIFIIVQAECMGHHDGIIGNPIPFDPSAPPQQQNNGGGGFPQQQGAPYQQYGQQQTAYGQSARAGNQNGPPGNFLPGGDPPPQYYGAPPQMVPGAGGGPQYGAGPGAYGGGGGPAYGGGGPTYGGGGVPAYGGGAARGPAGQGAAAVPPPQFGGGAGAVARNDAPARIMPIRSLNPFRYELAVGWQEVWLTFSSRSPASFISVWFI